MDFTPILATVLIQYQALAAPVLVPVRASTEGGGPSPLTASLPTIQYQAHASPIVVPSQVVSPVTGASPVFPSRVFPPRRLHASQHQAFAFDRFAAPDAVVAPEMPPTQVQIPLPLPRRVATYALSQPEFGVPTEVPVMSWTGHFPDTLTQWKKRTHPARAQMLAWDVLLFPAVVTAPDMAQPVFPERVPGRRHVVAHPQPAAPVFVADTTIIAPQHAWDPQYPDRLYPKRGLQARRQQSFVYSPLPIPVVAVSDVTGPHRFRVPAHHRTFRVPAHARRFRT